MPFIPGSSGINDVYHATNIYGNKKLIALWEEPSPSPAVGAPEAVQVTLSIAQSEAIASSGALATSAAEAEVGLAGRGEVPHEGPLEKTSKSESNGAYVSDPAGFPAKLDPNADPSAVFGVLAKNLDAALKEAGQGKWKETGKNPCIIACYKAVGVAQASDSVPWCAAFAGAVIKASGVQALKTLSSLAYRGFGTVVPLADKSKWRLNDIVVFSRQGGGHIGFFRGYNPSNGSVLIAGGNQADNLNEVPFRQGGASMPIVSVSRAWSVPAAYDKPVTFTGVGNSSVKVV